MRIFILGLAAVALCATAPRLHAQLTIDHVGLECIAPGRYAVVLSGIGSGEEIQLAKVYFRSSLFPDFYYVQMKQDGDRYVGILPQVARETPKVVYYIEAIDSSFHIARSAEFAPVVEDPCDDRALAEYVPGTDPGIVVGTTTEGQSALPPGFSAVGIIGTVAAAGAAATAGAGVSTGVVVAAAAGAAGVAGGAVATQGPSQEETTTTVEPPPVSTTSRRPTTTVTTTTVPAATTSTAVSTTTTVETTTTVIPARPLNPECFTVTDLGSCTVHLDAACVNPPVDRYEWVLDQSDKWGREYIPDGETSFDYHWANCGDRDQRLVFRLTVYRGGESVSRVRSVAVSGQSQLQTQMLTPMRLVTQLALPPFDGTAYGRLLFSGGASSMVQSAQPAELSVPAAAGVIRVEAVVMRGGEQPGEWRFDLGREARFVRGSLEVLQGSVLVLEPSVIVFRINGQPRERVVFTLELDR